MPKENFCVARVATRTRKTVTKFERHIERKNETYENVNVDLFRTPMNVSFKNCGALTYNEYLDKLIDTGTVSLKGLKEDATIFDEMIMDVNTDYFEQNGGYEYACKFYEEAFHFTEKLYGKDNIISAVMHADELNTAMTEKYGRPIYHYHLHVMALPVVDKEVRWSKRCKDPELIGTVKEVIHQVSHSKKWKSKKALDENGNPILNGNGKQVYRASYSILQDNFFEHMQQAGFKGFNRGERGSTVENLSTLEYKIKQDEKRLSSLEEKITESQIEYKENRDISMTFVEIDNSGKKSFTGKYTLSADSYEKLTALAKKGYSAEKDTDKLRKENIQLRWQLQTLQSEISQLKQSLSDLREKCRPYLEAVKASPETVKEFISDILEKFKKQEKSILYQPASPQKIHSTKNKKRSTNDEHER